MGTNQICHVNPNEIAVVVEEQVVNAARKFAENNTPRPDAIPNIALSIAAKTAPGILAQVVKAYLREKEFLEQRKLQKRMVIPKTGKPLATPPHIDRYI